MLPIIYAADVTAVSSTDWASIMTALTNQISVSTVVGVLASIAGACVGLVFMHWGVKRSVRALMSAFKRGKLRL